MNFSCGAHMGDCMWSLVMIRRMPGEHKFFCIPEYVTELRELMSDTPHYVGSIHEIDPRADSVDTWLGNPHLGAYGIRWEHQQDVMGFVFDYYNALGNVYVPGGPVFKTRKDMLWDSQAIIDALPTVPHPEVLVINAEPHSGQCPQYDKFRMAELVLAMYRRWNVEVTSAPGRPNYTLAQIGAMSLTARYIIGVATGPIWPTFNKWNQKAERIILLEPLQIDMGIEGKITHVFNTDQLFEEMQKLT